MRKQKIIWLLYPTYLFIIFLCLLPIAWIITSVDKKFYFQTTARHLKAQAYLVGCCVNNLLTTNRQQDLNQLCQELGKNIRARITVILPGGNVLADTQENPQQMENHLDRPEIQQALQGKDYVIERHSYTLHEDMIYLAVPQYTDGKIAAVIRLSIATDSFFQILKKNYFQIALYLGAIALLAILISWIIARMLSKPLEQMQECARAFAAGDFDRKLPPSQALEINSLAEGFNEMGMQIDNYLRATVQQKNEQEAILASMEEGVLAIDAQENVIAVNQSAAGLFGIEADSAKGKNYRAVIRYPEIQRFIHDALNLNMPVKGEITIYVYNQEISLLVNGAAWIDENKKILGTVLVLNDISRLKALEKIRREFVANVSHELKTPITLIQGFVETLLDGAMHDPQDSQKFLDTILDHTQRLHMIIEDLLSLSKIEQMENQDISKVKTSLLEIAEQARQNCATKAETHRVRLEINNLDNIILPVNPNLLERALTNLIDNAIKYSSAGSRVQVEIKRVDQEVQISVQDTGCGIALEHLPRLFERFYRVDKSRSRQEGGTGLGLAIVKHIVQIHGGQVSVSSVLGQGSIFTIHLPFIE